MIDMYRFDNDDNAVLKIRLEGLLTQQEYEVFRSHIASEIRQHKALRLMFEMADGLRWEPRSQWRELKLDSTPHTDISKIAIIGGDRAWRDWAQRACSAMKAEILLGAKASGRHLDRHGAKERTKVTFLSCRTSQPKAPHQSQPRLSSDASSGLSSGG